VVRAHVLRAGTIYEGDWLQAPLEPGYTLAILDGPYGIGKAGWDKMGIEGLADWYAPHLARVSTLLAASASMYVWNTAPGLKRLDPVIRGLGWTWRADITWHKGGAQGALIGAARASTWPDITETCSHYQRGAAYHQNPEQASNVWYLDPSNEMRHGERLYTDDRKTRSTTGYDDRVPLHPCQKPLLFAERMIRASTRPGERVLVPFGGTNREAVVMEWLARSTPDEARRYDACELNQDPGRDYVAAALAQINGEDPRQKAAGQEPLFRRGVAV
jgi:DNA modification methylase